MYSLSKINESLEKRAQKYSQKAHEGQRRKFADEPYVEHPKRVAEIVKKFKKSKSIDSLVTAALLHDTIEDTGTTTRDLEKMFGGLVASLVNELTSDKEDMEKTSKKEYLTNKMKNMSSWGLVIKLADRLDNVSDLRKAPRNFAKKYKEETEFILNRLEKERNLSGTQERIIERIREKLNELENVNEEFVTATKNMFGTMEIFANPSRKEIKTVSQYMDTFRFLIDKHGNVFVFPPDLLHDQAKEILRKQGVATNFIAASLAVASRDGKIILVNPDYKPSKIIKLLGKDPLEDYK